MKVIQKNQSKWISGVLALGMVAAVQEVSFAGSFTTVDRFRDPSVQPIIEQPKIWQEELARAQMEVSEGSYAFKGLTDATLILTGSGMRQEDGPQGMILEYNSPRQSHGGLTPSEKVQVRLEIIDKTDEGCGSVGYVADLPRDTTSTRSPDSPHFGERFRVVFTDHSNRICKDYRPYLWEASVRKGFGFCGTGDSTMNLRGNPIRFF